MGERLLWFRVASHLGMPVQAAMESMTSTEFLDWVWFLEWRDTEEFNRTDFYLAQIAAQIEKGQVKSPGRVTTKNKLLKFVREDKHHPESVEHRVQNSKNYWMGLCGAGNKSQQKLHQREMNRRRKKDGLST